MKHTELIEATGLSRDFDIIMAQELSRIAIRNADATKGLAGVLSNLSRLTSFEKLESLYDFNGIAYVLLRSRILKEAAKRPLPPVLDIDFFTSQDMLLALAADCGATPYLGQIGKKSMSKAYLHANWQVVAVMAWFQEHPEDQLERYTLRKGKQYEIARRFIIEKLYSKGKLFYEFFDGTSYMELCRKYDLGYEKAEPSAGAEPSPEGNGSTTNNFINVFGIAVGIQINEIPPSISPNQWEKMVEFFSSLQTEQKEQRAILETASDAINRIEAKLDGFESELYSLLEVNPQPTKLSEADRSFITKKLVEFKKDWTKSISTAARKYNDTKKQNSDSELSELLKAVEQLKEDLKSFKFDAIRAMVETGDTNGKYGALIRLMCIDLVDTKGDLLLKTKNQKDDGKIIEMDLKPEDPIFVIQKGKQSEVLKLLFSDTVPGEANKFSTYSYVRRFLKCYDSEGNITDLNRDSFNTEKSNNLKRPKN